MRLATRHLSAARQHQGVASSDPADFIADLAARTHARRAHQHADLAKAALRPPREAGPIIRLR